MKDELRIYDYKTINVKKICKYRSLDAVSAFGYEVIETKEMPNSLIISLKRDANIKNKEELDKMLDNTLKKIEVLNKYEGSKKNKATIFGLSFGILGLLTFGGGMSLALTETSFALKYVLGSILGVIGIVIMIINDPLYKNIYQKNINKVLPKIEELNNEINKLLIEGNELLKGSLE